MPELRRDPIIGRWVIISTERAKRPDQFSVAIAKEDLAPGEQCPFCEGNEHLTPPEIYALRKPGTKPNGPGWDVRVVPSIAPLLRIEGDLDRHGHGMYDLMNARGVHEIIIEAPHHVTDFAMTRDKLIKTAQVILDRMQDLERDERIKYVLLFKNYGEIAGGGHIKHSRLQLIGTPVNLKRVKEELTGAKAYYDYRDRCVMCDIIRQEVQARKRVVLETENMISFMPFASRFPFETWIVPKKHSCDFYKLDRAHIPEFAGHITTLFGKLRAVIGDFPYNVVLHTAPFRHAVDKRRGQWETIEYDYHWHFEVLPILTRVAGFEWGSGFYINPLPPEDACASVCNVAVPGMPTNEVRR